MISHMSCMHRGCEVKLFLAMLHDLQSHRRKNTGLEYHSPFWHISSATVGEDLVKFDSEKNVT